MSQLIMERLDSTKFMSGFDKVKHIFKPEYSKITFSKMNVRCLE